MKLQLLTETFESYSVTTLKEESGKAWLLAKDLAGPTSLNQVTIRRHIQDLEPSDKVVHTVNTPGGPQKMTFVSESGALQIIIQSHKPEAKRLRKWVCDLAVRYAKGELVSTPDQAMSQMMTAMTGAFSDIAEKLIAAASRPVNGKSRPVVYPALTNTGRSRMQRDGFLPASYFLQIETGNCHHRAGMASGLTARCLHYVKKFRTKDNAEYSHRFTDGGKTVVYVHADILKIVHRNNWKTGDLDPLTCSLLDGRATRGKLRALPGGKSEEAV